MVGLRVFCPLRTRNQHWRNTMSCSNPSCFLRRNRSLCLATVVEGQNTPYFRACWNPFSLFCYTVTFIYSPLLLKMHYDCHYIYIQLLYIVPYCLFVNLQNIFHKVAKKLADQSLTHTPAVQRHSPLHHFFPRPWRSLSILLFLYISKDVPEDTRSTRRLYASRSWQRRGRVGLGWRHMILLSSGRPHCTIALHDPARIKIQQERKSKRLTLIRILPVDIQSMKVPSVHHRIQLTEALTNQKYLK